MYKVLLVDDEALFTDYLQHLIDWSLHGCTLCGIAKDGEQALQMALQHRPDIMFLDINLPIMNGLETCRQLREKNIPCEIVIVSAHSDFQFARTAIQYEVAGYLLKPFDKAEFLQTLQICFQNVRLKGGEILRRCLSGQETLTGINVAVLVHKKADNDELKVLAENIEAEYQCKGAICLYFVEPDRITFACSIADAANIQPLIDFFAAFANPSTCIAIGDAANDIAQSFSHAKLVLENRVLAQQSILCYENLKQQSSNTVFSQSDLTRLIGCLNHHDNAGVSELVCRLFGLEGSHGISFQYFASVLSSLTLHMAQHYGKNRTNVEKLLIQQNGVIKDISDASDIYEMQSLIENYIYELYSDCTVLAPLTRRAQMVEKINSYIKSNYQQQCFTVEKMATALLFENSYIRRIYKTETGITILKALEDYRIHEAKQMLMQHRYRHSEIAEMTGFADQYYFSKRFKQIVGCTPSEYEVITKDE